VQLEGEAKMGMADIGDQAQESLLSLKVRCGMLQMCRPASMPIWPKIGSSAVTRSSDASLIGGISFFSQFHLLSLLAI